MPAFRRFYRVDVADNVGNRHVGRGEFSTNRESLLTQSIFVSSPFSWICRPNALNGSNGLSLISEPAIIGISSSNNSVNCLIILLFACPRKPNKMILCFAKIALTIVEEPILHNPKRLWIISRPILISQSNSPASRLWPNARHNHLPLIHPEFLLCS